MAMSPAEALLEAPVFRPTLEEFAEPLAFFNTVAAAAQTHGLAKVVPPVPPHAPGGGLLARKTNTVRFATRVQSLRVTEPGAGAATYRARGREYTPAQYEKAAHEHRVKHLGTAATLPATFVEQEYWRLMTGGGTKEHTVEYGSDVEGTAFAPPGSGCALGRSAWNLNRLPRADGSVLGLLKGDILGVTAPMLYFGMLYSTFAWHVEDHFMHSINYHHFGEPKTWYGVPADDAEAFEEAAARDVYGESLEPAARQAGLEADLPPGRAAAALLATKTTMFAPGVARARGVRVCHTVQHAGEFVITFPRAYHAGFSHGYNCGEAVNFATADWLPHGRRAVALYRELRSPPLLPHEELIVREAQRIVARERSGAVPPVKPAADGGHEQRIADEFCILMREQNAQRARLREAGARSRHVPSAASTSLPCSVCKGRAYLAAVTCACAFEPVCLHDAVANTQCRCGSQRTVWTRRETRACEQDARTFEERAGGPPEGFRWADLPTDEGGGGDSHRMLITSAECAALKNAWPEACGDGRECVLVPQHLVNCVRCEADHNGSYGSGRFCSLECAKEFAARERHARSVVPPVASPPAPAPPQPMPLSPPSHPQEAPRQGSAAPAVAVAAAATEGGYSLPPRKRLRRDSSVPSAIGSGEWRSGDDGRSDARRESTVGGRLDRFLNSPDSPLPLLVDEKVRLPSKPPRYFARRVYGAGPGANERLLLAKDVVVAVLGDGRPTSSVAAYLSMWLKRGNSSLSKHWMARAYCKSHRPGEPDRNLYVVSASDVKTVTRGLTAEQVDRLRLFVRGVWDQMPDPAVSERAAPTPAPAVAPPPLAGPRTPDSEHGDAQRAAPPDVLASGLMMTPSVTPTLVRSDVDLAASLGLLGGSKSSWEPVQEAFSSQVQVQEAQHDGSLMGSFALSLSTVEPPTSGGPLPPVSDALMEWATMPTAAPVPPPPPPGSLVLPPDSGGETRERRMHEWLAGNAQFTLGRRPHAARGLLRHVGPSRALSAGAGDEARADGRA